MLKDVAYIPESVSFDGWLADCPDNAGFETFWTASSPIDLRYSLDCRLSDIMPDEEITKSGDASCTY